MRSSGEPNIKTPSQHKASSRNNHNLLINNNMLRLNYRFIGISSSDRATSNILLDRNALPADNIYTTHPLQRHLVGSGLGRKNRLLGGFFISGEGLPA